MSYYVGIPLLLFVALFEASVLPLFTVYGLQPDLMLVLLVAWLMVRGANEAFFLAPIGGLLLGLVDYQAMGTALIGLAPLAFLQELRGSQLREGGIVMAVAFTVAMTVFYNFAYLAVDTLQGESGDWLAASSRVIIPTALVNVAVLVPLYFTILAFSRERRQSAYA